MRHLLWPQHGKLTADYREIANMNLSRRIAATALALILPAVAFANTNSEAAFKKMQSLAGEWTGTDDHAMQAKSTFKLIVSGTTIMETLAMSGMEEMVTFYHIDGNAITLVHYLNLKGRPTCLHLLPAISTSSRCISTTQTTSLKPGFGVKTGKTPPWLFI